MATTIREKFKKRKKQVKKKNEPLWKGPVVDGITSSLLNRYIQCKERFRIVVMEGWKPEDHFNHRIEYGQMWHLCKELWSEQGDWESGLFDYAAKLCRKYPLEQEQVNKWYQVCNLQFKIYLDWLKSIKKEGKQVLQEQVFRVPYVLPSGRVVNLRGKWDGLTQTKNGFYLEEYKTKGQVDEESLKRQLTFDLQTMLYLVALIEWDGGDGDGLYGYGPILGVNYTVIRRPLSGGKGTIRRHKPTKGKPLGESPQEFYQRLDDIIREEQDYFFISFQSMVSDLDIRRFKDQFLDPILEDLWNWWEEQIGMEPTGPSVTHWRTPYGIYNVLAEGGHTELDNYLDTGFTIGLTRAETLFPELGD